ncbi:cupin domain-containing protein [Paenibacillus sp. TAB 01]|uniref:cupin domain-containing protein n=1 Tax=Paenibacillus sp. TAB 01 TaxID=3368988 RepID=UPI0037520707
MPVNVNLTAYDKEQVDYADPNFRIKLWTVHHSSQPSVQYGPWHYHEEVEFIAVLQGTLTMETTHFSYNLQAGHVVILGSNELHRSHKHKHDDLLYIVCHVDMAAFMDPSLLPYLAAFTGRSANLTQLNETLRKYPASLQVTSPAYPSDAARYDDTTAGLRALYQCQLEKAHVHVNSDG